jgi:hypothetical protein
VLRGGFFFAQCGGGARNPLVHGAEGVSCIFRKEIIVGLADHVGGVEMEYLGKARIDHEVASAEILDVDDRLRVFGDRLQKCCLFANAGVQLHIQARERGLRLHALGHVEGNDVHERQEEGQIAGDASQMGDDRHRVGRKARIEHEGAGHQHSQRHQAEGRDCAISASHAPAGEDDAQPQQRNRDETGTRDPQKHRRRIGRHVLEEREQAGRCRGDGDCKPEHRAHASLQ